jgi:hypothetical protein
VGQLGDVGKFRHVGKLRNVGKLDLRHKSINSPKSGLWDVTSNLPPGLRPACQVLAVRDHSGARPTSRFAIAQKRFPGDWQLKPINDRHRAREIGRYRLYRLEKAACAAFLSVSSFPGDHV